MDPSQPPPQPPSMNPFMRTFVPTLTQPNAPSNRPSFAYSSSRKRARTPDDVPSSSEDDEEADSGDDAESLQDAYAMDHDDEPGLSKEEEDAQLEANNRGMKMLLRLGWSKGQGLGKEGQGRTEPIDPSSNFGLMGLGKASQDKEWIDSTVNSGPRALESQRIAKETKDQRDARMAKAAYVEQVKSEIAATLEKFKCDICNKSYANVSQYNEHLNSYDHHHRARAVATRQAELERAKANGESDKRRDKEAKREAKMLAKQMGAAGIKVDLTSAGVGVKKADKVDTPKKVVTGGGGWAKFGGGGGGFAPIGAGTPTTTGEAIQEGSTPSSTPAKTGGFKKSGWATVGASSSAPEPSSPAPVPQPPAVSTAAPSFRSGGTFHLSPDDPPDPPASSSGGSNPPPPPTPAAPPPPPSLPPPPPPPSLPPSPPPPTSAPRSGWQPVNSSAPSPDQRRPFDNQGSYNSCPPPPQDPYNYNRAPPPPSRDDYYNRAPPPPPRDDWVRRGAPPSSSSRDYDRPPPSRDYGYNQSRDNYGYDQRPPPPSRDDGPRQGGDGRAPLPPAREGWGQREEQGRKDGGGWDRREGYGRRY